MLIRQSVLTVLLLLLCTAATASPTTELVERLDQIKSLSGDFQQSVLDKGGTRLQEASGTMKMQRGNRFRWHTLLPFEQLVVSDGTTVWVYDVDLLQVVEKPLDENSASTPALLFGGDPEEVSEVFIVEQGEARGGEQSFILTPRSEEAMFVELEMTFRDKSPISMRLEDALGQQTVLTFSDVRINRKLAGDAFTFVAPPDADVIRQQE